MKKYIFITNIPTPYRTSFYNELAVQDFNFEVYYMRQTEADRNWNIDLTQLSHQFYIDRGFYKMFGRFHLHFNPKLIFKILDEKNAEIIIGGGWNDPDVLILVILKRLGILKNRLHFWTEANYLTLGASNDNIIKKKVRKFVYNCTSGAQLSSGKMTEITLDQWGIKTNAFIPLPNTIEEDKYRISNQDIESRYEKEALIFLMPVRLHEQVKGIINFFSAIGAENIRKGIFIVAGDGPDKERIQAFISSLNVGDSIKLLGHCNTEELVALYKKANVFILPSFTDASPLTLVEALRMHLPVLVSERCGNHFEAVKENKNGFLFDPYNHESIKSAYEHMLVESSRWREMGEMSAQLYNMTFCRTKVIKNFIDQLEKFSSAS